MTGELAAATNETTGWVVVLVVWWTIWGALGWRIGENYGGDLKWLGLILGLLLGPIGLLILVVVGGLSPRAVRARETDRR